jgi:hypothetical protein
MQVDGATRSKNGIEKRNVMATLSKTMVAMPEPGELLGGASLGPLMVER